MTQKEAMEKISAHVETASANLEEAKKIADEFGLSFVWDLAYGMGGSYHGKGTKNWNYSDSCSDEVQEFREEGEWLSSSTNC